MTKRDGDYAAGKNLGRRDFLKTAGSAAGALAVSNFPLANIARADFSVIKIGHMSLITGARAPFGQTSPWVIRRMTDLVKNGLKIGSKTYTVEILSRDTQSDPNRTASLANELVLRENVDIMLNLDGIAAPAMEICDNNGTPMITTLLQPEPFYAQRGSSAEKGYPWNYLFFWSSGDIIRNFMGMWNSVETNKIVGTAFIENEAGQGMEKAFASALKGGGFTEVAGGRFRIDTDDLSNQVTKFKEGNAQILTGIMFPPHVATLLGQLGQANYSPEVITMAAAFLFPTDLDSLGDKANGMSTEVSWTPNWGTTSSLTHQTAREFAADWENSTGKQWLQLGAYDHAMWEVGLEALKASGDPKDRQAVRNAINNMTLNTIVGQVDFKGSKSKNVASTQLAAGQWRKSKGGKFKYDLEVCYNGTAPSVPLGEKFKLLSQLT